MFLLTSTSNFSPKKKIAQQPITDAVPVKCVTEKGLAVFLFGIEIGGHAVCAATIRGKGLQFVIPDSISHPNRKDQNLICVPSCFPKNRSILNLFSAILFSDYVTV